MIKNVFLTITSLSCIFSGCVEKKTEQPTSSSPPIAEKTPYVLTMHNDMRQDPYYWLKDRHNPKTLEYLNTENQYTDQMMSHTLRLQDQLFFEMKERIPKDDESVPEKKGDFVYFWRINNQQQYPVFFRKNLTNDQEICYLDCNELAKNKAFFSLGSLEVSPDQQTLAYSVDTRGSEIYSIYFKDLHNGNQFTEQIYGTSPGIKWANDHQTLFYTIYDETKRPFKVYRHRLGKDPTNDQLVYEENDPTFRVTLEKTRDEKYILINTRSILTSEILLIDAHQPEIQPQMFRARESNVDYSIEHHDTDFIITTNINGAKNFKLMTASDSNFNKWHDLFDYDEKIMIEAVDVFKDFMAIYQRKDGNQGIVIYDFATTSSKHIPFSDTACEISKENNREYATPCLRYGFSSLITPYSVNEYDIANSESRLLKKDYVAGYDETLYQQERISVVNDGISIPLTIAYRKDLKTEQPSPLLLTGYGAYGICDSPCFSSYRVSMLNRGVVFAIAHIRGGGEKGRDWYNMGKYLNKKNSFVDFIKCSEYLINNGYTSAQQLAIDGRSAGGLLVGAVLNMRPDLYQAAIAGVPFVDVITTMSDSSIPLTANEYDEWGNPENLNVYQYMKDYSPYDNVSAQHYPHLLITAGFNDSRVAYWEPAKWTAKLRATKTDNNLLLLQTNMNGGHAGATARFEHMKEKAFHYSFILDRLGLNSQSIKLN